MKTLTLLLPLLLFACKPGGEGGGPHAPAKARAEATSRIAGLTGLYEGDADGGRDRMCIIGRGAGAHFGLVVMGAAGASCSGTGSASRFGDTMRLEMQGDSACALSARIEGGALVFPSSVPAGCAYYCARGASLAGTRLVQKGAAARDAARARDLVGDPLCRPHRD